VVPKAVGSSPIRHPKIYKALRSLFCYNQFIMSDQNQKKFTLNLVALNKNVYVKKFRSFGDKLADKVTTSVGSSAFLVLNIIWFTIWILINTGQFGEQYVFDEYPFGFLTLAVSLEAIILAVFVLISQNRQAERSEIRSELDYVTDLQADAEINIILNILERLSDKQSIDVSDLLEQLEINQKKILKEHSLIENGDENNKL
jgi:uncharacterized membrane protein